MKAKHWLLILGIGLTAIAGIIMYQKLSSFKSKLLRIARAEYKKWVLLKEVQAKASKILLTYWKSVGLTFKESQMQEEDFQAKYPWSSAFISYLFYKAGANERFPYASSHSVYFQKAKANKKNEKANLRGFRISEYAPQKGDLIVYTRQTGAGYDSKGFFPSHGELVLKVGKGYIEAIGGNVSNTVKISRYTTDEKGYLTQKEKPFFMVIQNNIQ